MCAMAAICPSTNGGVLPSPDISPSRLSNKQMSFFSEILPDTKCAGRALARWGTFARVRARARYTIRHGYASALFLRGLPLALPVFMRGVPPRAPVFMRGVPPRAPRLKAPSTRTRAKSCAMIAALDEISGLAPRAVHVRVSASPLLRGCREALGSWPEQHLRDSFLSLDDGEIGEVASIRNAIRAKPARGSPPRRDA